MPDFRELLRESEGAGDTATILVAGTIGFVVDAALSVHGAFSPGTVGTLSAGGALGLKKGLQGKITTRRSRARAKDVIKLLAKGGDPDDHPGAKRIGEELRLNERKLTDAATLDRAVAAVVRDYRAELAE